MQLSIRTVFAVLLWLCAAYPLVLYALNQLGSPMTAGVAARAIGGALRWTLLVAIAAGLVGALLYPPFIPRVRLSLRNARARLGTNLGPLREAQARLEYLDTAADQMTAGRVLRQLGRPKEAVVHLLRAAELDPDHAATHYQLGLALTDVGEPARAAEQFARVIQIDPNHAFGAAMLELGVALERADAPEQAVAMLRRHQREFGEHRRALFHRARAHTALGQTDAARADLEAAARPPEEGRHVPPEEALIRAQARVALLRGGRIR